MTNIVAHLNKAQMNIKVRTSYLSVHICSKTFYAYLFRIQKFIFTYIFNDSYYFHLRGFRRPTTNCKTLFFFLLNGLIHDSWPCTSHASHSTAACTTSTYIFLNVFYNVVHDGESETWFIRAQFLE